MRPTWKTGKMAARAPFLAQQAEDRRDERAGVADADPEHEVDDVPGPIDRIGVAPDADARGDEVNQAGDGERGDNRREAEAPPPPHGGLALDDAADFFGDPVEVAAVLHQHPAGDHHGLDLGEDGGSRNRGIFGVRHQLESIFKLVCHSERSEESQCGADALVRHASRGEGTPPTRNGLDRRGYTGGEVKIPGASSGAFQKTVPSICGSELARDRHVLSREQARSESRDNASITHALRAWPPVSSRCGRRRAPDSSCFCIQCG